MIILTALKNVMVDQNSNFRVHMLLKGAVNWNLERFASAGRGKLNYSVKKNPQCRTRINYKIIQPIFDAEEGFKPMLVASTKSHHCHIPTSHLISLGIKPLTDFPTFFPSGCLGRLLVTTCRHCRTGKKHQWYSSRSSSSSAMASCNN